MGRAISGAKRRLLCGGQPVSRTITITPEPPRATYYPPWSQPRFTSTLSPSSRVKPTNPRIVQTPGPLRQQRTGTRCDSDSDDHKNAPSHPQEVVHHRYHTIIPTPTHSHSRSWPNEQSETTGAFQIQLGVFSIPPGWAADLVVL